MKLLLALDVGNNHVTAGVLSGAEILTRWRLVPTGRKQKTIRVVSVSTVYDCSARS